MPPLFSPRFFSFLSHLFYVLHGLFSCHLNRPRTMGCMRLRGRGRMRSLLLMPCLTLINEGADTGRICESQGEIRGPEGTPRRRAGDGREKATASLPRPVGKGRGGTQGAGPTHGRGGTGRRLVLGEQGTGWGSRSPGLLSGGTVSRNHSAGGPPAHSYPPKLSGSPVPQGLAQDDRPKGAGQTLPITGALLRILDRPFPPPVAGHYLPTHRRVLTIPPHPTLLCPVPFHSAYTPTHLFLVAGENTFGHSFGCE